MMRHFPADEVADRVQIGPTMMIDNPFGLAGRTRGVIKRDCLPLVSG